MGKPLGSALSGSSASGVGSELFLSATAPQTHLYVKLSDEMFPKIIYIPCRLQPTCRSRLPKGLPTAHGTAVLVVALFLTADIFLPFHALFRLPAFFLPVQFLLTGVLFPIAMGAVHSGGTGRILAAEAVKNSGPAAETLRYRAGTRNLVHLRRVTQCLSPFASTAAYHVFESSYKLSPRSSVRSRTKRVKKVVPDIRRRLFPIALC